MKVKCSLSEFNVFLQLSRKSYFLCLDTWLPIHFSLKYSTHAYDFEGFSKQGHASLVLMLSYWKGLFIQNQKLMRDDQKIICMFLKNHKDWLYCSLNLSLVTTKQMEVPSINGNNIYQLFLRSTLKKFLLPKLVRRLVGRSAWNIWSSGRVEEQMRHRGWLKIS
jgi:hypothetical protein